MQAFKKTFRLGLLASTSLSPPIDLGDRIRAYLAGQKAMGK